jgi:hypothetical protein
MDFAGFQLKMDIAQGGDPTKTLGYPAGRQDRRGNFGVPGNVIA